MEENLFRATYDELRERACPFEKAILRGCCACPLSVRLHVAERIGIGCRRDAESARCKALFHALQHSARFALKLSNPDTPLPHGKRIKVECGGLHGLQKLIEPDATPPVEDIDAVVSAALETFGGLDAIPFQRLMPDIRAFQGRPPRHPDP